MKKTDLLRTIIEKNPNYTDDEIVAASNGVLSKRIVSIYLKRFEERKEILIRENENGTRSIMLNDPVIKKSYKVQILEQMLDIYLEDFESASLFEERVEIGKIMLRILEKL